VVSELVGCDSMVAINAHMTYTTSHLLCNDQVNLMIGIRMIRHENISLGRRVLVVYQELELSI
jgi:hypothetical protein